MSRNPIIPTFVFSIDFTAEAASAKLLILPNGDLMFISPNLPHVWKNDKDFYQDNKDLKVDVFVIHFRENALKEDFFDLPEFVMKLGITISRILIGSSNL